MSKFSEYASSTAFTVSLSNPQIECLYTFYIDDWDLTVMYSMATIKALGRKGLVEWKKNEKGKYDGCSITEEGKKLAELLDMAGYFEMQRRGEAQIEQLL